MKGNNAVKVFVTGSDGYVGCKLVDYLVQKGYIVRGLDTFYYEDCLFGEPGRAVPTARKDVRTLTLDDLRGYDAVIHLAALSNDPVGSLDPHLTMEINYLGSSRVAELAKAAGVRRFLYASSCSLYGKSSEDWVDETSPMAPLTAYAQSKVMTEGALQKLADRDFSPVILRCATVYGLSHKLRVDLVVNNLAAWGVTRNEVRILSDGTPWRPLIHVEDLARAYEYFLQAPLESVHNRAFNVGFDEQNYQVRTIAESVAEALPGVEVTFSPQPDKDARSYRVTFDKFLSLSGLQPQWNLQSSVRNIVGEYQRQKLTWENFSGRKYVRLNQIRHLMASGLIDDRLLWRSA